MAIDGKKIYLTEFKVGTVVYEGPYIYANSFEEADIEAVDFGVVIVGEAAIVKKDNNEEEWNRVLH
jgi:hypothetical protein|tara:strand:- start:2497 stop:2694 length:198 start_codon:yes stop_codon:yes gene_type:complete